MSHKVVFMTDAEFMAGTRRFLIRVVIWSVLAVALGFAIGYCSMEMTDAPRHSGVAVPA